MVVAQVGDEVVTLSELVAETGRVLVETRGPQVALEGGLPRSLLRSVLQSVVHNELLHQEVLRLQLPDVPREDVERAFAGFVGRFDDLDDLRAFYDAYGFEPSPEAGQPPELLRRLLRQRLRVDRFISVRIRLRTGPPAGAVNACLGLVPERFGALSRADARKLVEAQIVKQLEEEALEALLRDLKERQEIRYAPGFAPQAETGPTEGFRCPLPPSDG
jgi:hypothetical protein